MTLPSPFDWLAEVAIPTAGVLASTAVAIAAFRTSRRATEIAEQAHRDQQKQQEIDGRREFADLFGALLTKRPEHALLPPFRADVLRAAETAPSGAADLASWYVSIYDEIAYNGAPRKGQRAARNPNQYGLREEAEARLRSWLRTGQANVSPFDWRPRREARTESEATLE